MGIKTNNNLFSFGIITFIITLAMTLLAGAPCLADEPDQFAKAQPLYSDPGQEVADEQMTETLETYVRIQALTYPEDAAGEGEAGADAPEIAERPYRCSEFGKKFIKNFEGLTLIKMKALRGESGWTIGWQHKGKAGEHIPDVISEDCADLLFEGDIHQAEDAVNRLIKGLNRHFRVHQGFVDAMTSLVYNCGETGIRESAFYQRLLRCRFNGKKINKADYSFAVVAIKLTHVVYKGHQTRRMGEYHLARGDYKQAENYMNQLRQ